MNPLLIARNLRDEYLRLLKTTFRPRQQELRERFNDEIERDGFLTREPFVALAQPYKFAPPIEGLLPETRQRFAPICETPYQHQAEACRRIGEGKPTVVATGTGSGKTEAFLLPIVDHCLRVHRPGVHSVKAILIYPMNALANDQNSRIRERLAGTDVSFGRYTRETRMWGTRPADAPENERILRKEFRDEPPDLLLTNYMMLEYMLMRGDGRDIFRDHEIRFIVLDEVHTYHGLLGTDVACLLRRLREALDKANPDVEPLFIGTSATLQAGEEGDPRAGVADFFTRLTGQPTPAESVITEVTDPPALPAGVTLSPAPDIGEDELAAFDAQNPDHVREIVGKLSGAPITDGEVGEAWSQMALPYLLMEWLRQPRSEDEIIDQLAARPEREGVDRAALRREVEAALLVGPCIDDTSAVRLRPRVHRFLRGLARFWRCTNPACGKLVGEGVDECDECGSRTLPLALCRTCGWDFFMAEMGGEEILEPWRGRRSDASTVFLFDPPTAQVDIDEEEDPIGEDDAELAAGSSGDIGDEEAEEDKAAEADKFLDPKSLRFVDPAIVGGDYPVRPVKLHEGRGTRCPVCRSRYGAQDVLTPVSLGNSSALTHVSRVVMRDLPASQRKLLVFCDSRQDAAHQSRFISASEDRARIRRTTYQALHPESEPHDLDWLVDEIYEQYIEEGVFKRSRKKDQQQRDKSVIIGALLNEFAIAPRVRAGLERLGLVKVRYASLAEELASEEFQRLCLDNDLNPDLAAQSVVVLLDVFRQRMALNHEILTRRLFPGDKLSRDFQITVNRQVGIPVAFLPPEQRTVESAGYKLVSTWNAKGNQTATQRIWRQFHGEAATPASLETLLRWLEGEERHYLVWQTIGSRDDQGSGWQVNVDLIEFEAGRSFLHCSVCDRIASNEPPGLPCTRSGCLGRMQPWKGPIEEGNLNALMAVQKYAPPLFPAEHSAAVPDELRDSSERGFMDGDPPRPNLLACTPTLEMGVNIGDLEAVAMRNIPPSPANYAQRSGRTGRVSRMGITAGFSRNTPHDGYFFDHPGEIIAGAIPPPKFNLRNLEAISRHVRSLILEHAQLDFPGNLEPYLTEKGDLVLGQVSEIVSRVKAAGDGAVDTAARLWGDIEGVNKQYVAGIAERFPEQIRSALVERGQLLANAAEEVKKLGEIIKLSPKEEQAQKGFRQLAIRLREDNKYAYLPRVLAEAGLLPGYSFPGDPGSVSLGYDPQPIFAGRLQSQREFAPGQIIYARVGRWRVTGVALHRPGASGSGGERLFDFTLCGSCGLANSPSLDFCARCRHPIGDSSGSGLRTFAAWDVGAFQAWEAEVAAESEEERAVQIYDIRPHPQRDVDGVRYNVGSWQLELREQEHIWFINHGLKDVRRMDEERALSPGFPLCPICGEYFKHDELVPKKKKKKDDSEKDARSRIDAHAKRCTGQPKAYSLGHQLRADTLRLIVPKIGSYGDEEVRWAWSLVYAMIQGAVRLFQIDPDDVEAYVLTKTAKDSEDHTRQEVLDILWIDRIVGGSGILHRLAVHFPKVAKAALDHLEGHECPNSCYRCLRSYRNQWWHKMLDWRMVVPNIRGLTGETVELAESVAAAASSTEGPEWDEARKEGCESPQELRLLKAIRDDETLPEPEKQYVVVDQNRILTRADFAYLDCEPKLLIYVDGLVWHSNVRQRVHDNRITNRLQTLGYRVLRFLGTETHNAPAECVEQIRMARIE